MLMVAMLLVVLTMIDEERKPYRMEWRKLSGMLLMGVILCSLSYILVYGKTLDWWDDKSIFWASIIFLLSSGGFLLNVSREGMSGYLPLGIFRYRNVMMSMLLFLLTILFNSASNYISAFAKLGTPINNIQSASLSGLGGSRLLFGIVDGIGFHCEKVSFQNNILYCIPFDGSI